MILDPSIRVMCDGCEGEEEFHLCPLAHSGSYDDRYINDQIDSLGWLTVSDDEHYCEDCRREHEEAPE